MKESNLEYLYEMPVRKNFMDLTGQKYGAWQVMGFAYIVKNRKTGFQTSYWECLCTLCGKTKKVIAKNNLRSDKMVFGCCNRTSPNVKRREDEIKGKQFGLLEAIEIDEVASKYQKRTTWLCKCHGCGKMTYVNGHELVGRLTRSCGDRPCRAKVRKMGELERLKDAGTEAPVLPDS